MPPISTPDFLARARTVALRALSEVSPAEAEAMEDYLEPLIETLIEGEPLPLDRSNAAGRFGTNWTDTVLVITLVLETLVDGEQGPGTSVTAAKVLEHARLRKVRLSQGRAERISLSIQTALSVSRQP